MSKKNPIVEELLDEAALAICSRTAKVLKNAAREIDTLSRENQIMRGLIVSKNNKPKIGDADYGN